jgi:hypothetical protein
MTAFCPPLGVDICETFWHDASAWPEERGRAMKRLVLVLLALAALAASAVFLIEPGAQASPGATVTVNSTADTNSRDYMLTLREAMLLATGGLALGDLDEGECDQVSNSTYEPPCSTTDTIGAASADTIIFDTHIASIELSSPLPTLSTGGDTVDGSAAGVFVYPHPPSGAFDCFEITSSGNTIKGLTMRMFRRGVYIHGDAQGNTIGGITTPGQCNGDCNDVWSEDAGVEISGTGASGNLVSGNSIRAVPIPSPTPPAPTPTPTGNPGVLIRQGAHNNTIGGTATGQGNTIAHTYDHGVRVDGADTNGNTIRGNSIHSNVGKGIDNINLGNTELAPPIIDSVGGFVSGHTNPRCYPCTVEVFSDNEDEGRTYHGSTTTNNDPTGTWVYTGAVTGPYITATVTDAGGNTSEFSAPVAYTPPAVGGIAELPDVPDSSRPNHIVLLTLGASALVALTAGAWHARRRWLR